MQLFSTRFWSEREEKSAQNLRQIGGAATIATVNRLLEDFNIQNGNVLASKWDQFELSTVKTAKVIPKRNVLV